MTIEMFEKPLGMRDDFPSIAKQKAQLRKRGTEQIERAGYELLQTPTLEYYETIGKISAISDDALFKLLDSQGKTLVLRPDMTSPIARVAASKLLREKMPIRLGYYSNVFRAQKREGGRPAEFEQMGVELIGDDSLYADAEVISLAWDILQELGIRSGRIVIGHARLLELILADFGLNTEQSENVQELFVAKNGVGFEQLAQQLPVPEHKQPSFRKLMQATTVSDWKPWINEENEEQQKLYRDMERLEKLLGQNGLGDAMTFDLSFSSHMTYYTGLVFEFYGAGSGFPLGSGGRYDGLLEKFGLQVGATGFGLRVDRLIETLSVEEPQEPHTLILFDEQSEQIAFDKAKQLRAEGKRVTLQFAPAVKALEQFSELFTKVIRGEELRNG
ncbi:ATP phosphoribosyltransferase regulatory subunit [Planococcus sp. ISL-109]|uniref:ATP phosphoribosyltransferase regulatory subunit n=1 Tax=Planococcus sp. ISL-109 TaxID=2819166 RepID=UPI001BEA1709|nr:ATP phosphoribosyltransferase regulatory subunit [Planococcus sp. ISL-109]MBT2583714.1 ATP phosphoribosyltransferase regulatory subunit [Planococcus sp. ISL-109]